MIDHEKIKQLRLAKHLSMEKAAELAGMCNAPKWQRIESGTRKNPSLVTTEAIAKVLGVLVDEILLPSDPGPSASQRPARKAS